MLVRDNQQATRSWFCGILEGEGSFHTSGGIQVRISNTNTDIINACESFLKSHNIWSTTGNQKRPDKKREYTITISNSRECILQYASVLYNVIEQSLECRSDEYQQILGASQTARDSSIDLNWMAGIYEAEGSFSLLQNNRNITALKIELPNTNRKVICKVERNLAAMQCAWHIRDRIPKKTNHQACQSVEIYGMKRCQRFLEAMNDRWISEINKKRTGLMLKYINTRLSHCYKDAYTSEELSMIQAVCDLNRG